MRSVFGCFGHGLRIRSTRRNSKRKKHQPVYTPGSVRRGLPRARRPFIWDGYCYPPQAIYPDDNPKQAWAQAPCHPYSILLLVGFTVPLTLLLARCALTAPFHPYLFCGQALSKKSCDVFGAGPFNAKPYPKSPATFLGPGQTGGLFSVALSLRSPSPDVIRHHFSVEPGLSSLLRKRPPDRLEGLHRTQNGEPVNGIRRFS